MLRLVQRGISAPILATVETWEGEGTPASWPSGLRWLGQCAVERCCIARGGTAAMLRCCPPPLPLPPLARLSWLSLCSSAVQCSTAPAAKVSRCLSDAVRSVVICGERAACARGVSEAFESAASETRPQGHASRSSFVRVDRTNIRLCAVSKLDVRPQRRRLAPWCASDTERRRES